MPRINRTAQRGAVLIIALLFLTILTILGVTAMTATTFEERMAGNTRDVGLAFQAAEAGLRDARRDINSIVIPPAPLTTARNPQIVGKTGFGLADADDGRCNTAAPGIGLCRPFTYDGTSGIPPRYNETFYVSQASVQYGAFTGAPPLVGVAQQPRYYIEVLCLPQHGGSIGDPMYCNFYRITSRGLGLNPNTRVTVQEIFLKP